MPSRRDSRSRSRDRKKKRSRSRSRKKSRDREKKSSRKSNFSDPAGDAPPPPPAEGVKMSASLAALLSKTEEGDGSSQALATMEAPKSAKPAAGGRKRGGWDNDPKELNRSGGGLGGLDVPMNPTTAGGFKQILIEIKAKNARFVIGRGGETIGKIRDETGANVQVEGGGKGSRPDEIIPIRILGPAMSAEMARDQVTIELLLHSDMDMDCPGGYEMEHIELEQRYVPKIVGPQGSYLREIEVQSKSRIAIRDQPGPRGSGYKTFRIIGRPGHATKGKEMIIAKAQEKNIGFQGSGGSEANAHPDVKKEFEVQQRLVGLLVGKGATGLKVITDSTGAGICLNQDTKDKGFSIVRLTGTQKQVNDAYNLLQTKLNEAEAKDQSRFGGRANVDWQCPNCKQQNSGSNNMCANCGSLQPAPRVDKGFGKGTGLLALGGMPGGQMSMPGGAMGGGLSGGDMMPMLGNPKGGPMGSGPGGGDMMPMPGDPQGGPMGSGLGGGDMMQMQNNQLLPKPPLNNPVGMPGGPMGGGQMSGDMMPAPGNPIGMPGGPMGSGPSGGGGVMPMPGNPIGGPMGSGPSGGDMMPMPPMPGNPMGMPGGPMGGGQMSGDIIPAPGNPMGMPVGPMGGGQMGGGDMMPIPNNFDPNIGPGMGMSPPPMGMGMGMAAGPRAAGEKKVCLFWLARSCREAMTCPDRHPPEFECELLRAEYKQKPCRFGPACQNQNTCLYNHDPILSDQGGKGGAFGGGFGAGKSRQDWICAACGAQNYGGRNTCHKCWEKKPAEPQAPPMPHSVPNQQGGVSGFGTMNSGGISNFGGQDFGSSNNFGGSNFGSNSFGGNGGAWGNASW